MSLSRRRALLGALASAPLMARSGSAGAVVIMDSAWHANGFRSHIALAQQPQFAPLVAFSEDEGEEWDDASGTWVGNFGGIGYVLTAGHCFKNGEPADHYLYRTNSGAIHEGSKLFMHPLYNGDGDTRSGYDVAIVGLDGEVNDAGPPPVLYAANIQRGDRIVFVGFGSRGTGSLGEQGRFDDPTDNKTAAEATIDKVMLPVRPVPEEDDAGNWLRITLRPESEGGNRMDGILGGGDSGGSAWIQRGGRWFIAGVNVTGSGDKYGDHSYFTRLIGVQPWLQSILPGLRFAQ
ncbi:Trypsin [Enhydrobacter aerosaccus]|uniref:Trypsin n=1 Tax=Enhydrobacter aerosaccus TaxID=225324 RepID=A0A1T4STQ9_9HYPH|nr:trypsin-like serine protease [Enhydrobacter aerosaccus]SKA31654.1 Trypsin [Enhydrobacter aerosaccus]